MKAVILCGGKGLRMGGHNNAVCKPLVKIGGMPILWHIMKIYKYYGVKEFILCLGYNGEDIKGFFMNLQWKHNNFILNTECENQKIEFLNEGEAWEITFVDTGLETLTGGRIKRIEKYIDEDNFLLTYGDGVADIPLDMLIDFHLDKGKIVTVTGVKHRSPFGIIEVKDGVATNFIEKPLLDGWINGGFFVLNKQVFDYIEGDGTVWEQEPLVNLVKDGQLAVYQHQGFWQCVDTVKDVQTMNDLWNKNLRPWVKW